QAGSGLDVHVGPGAAREDDGFTTGQRFADGLEGFPPHYEHLAHGNVLEPFEIFGQMPGNFIAVADDAVERHGGDGGEVFPRDYLAVHESSILTTSAWGIPGSPRSLIAKRVLTSSKRSNSRTISLMDASSGISCTAFK